MTQMTPESVVCRRCEAQVGEKCKGKTGVPHVERVKLAWLVFGRENVYEPPRRRQQSAKPESGTDESQETLETQETLEVSAWSLRLWQGARARAKVKGVPFEITEAHVREAMPTDRLCPVLGIELIPGQWSLDRVIPARGYVPGNIAIISRRANTVKNAEADPEVFRKIAAYIESHRPDAP